MKLNSTTPKQSADAPTTGTEFQGAPRRKTVENLLQVIHSEHEIVKSLMLELESEHRPSVRADIFRRLQVKLLCHVHAEEHVIFCHLSRYSDAVGFVTEHQLGHQQIAEAAEVLNSLNGKSKSWGRLLFEFVELVNNHIVGTEEMLFGLVNTYFATEHLETLASQYRWAAYRRYREIQEVTSPALHRVR